MTDRKGTNVDPSWSPDGRTIVFVGCPGSFCTPSSHEIYTIPATGGAATRLTHDGTQDNDPYFSHGGTELAWLSKVSGGLLDVGVWDIRTMPVVAVRRCRSSAAPALEPKRLINDDNINSKPSWSLDDKTIYFHRAVARREERFPDLGRRSRRHRPPGAHRGPGWLERVPGDMRQGETRSRHASSDK